MYTPPKDAWKRYIYTLAYRATKGAWKPHSWLKYMSDILQKTVLTPHGRLILNVPPQHGKSFLCSYMLPVWYLTNFPHKNVMVVSAEADFAKSWGAKVRDLFLSCPELGVKLEGRQPPASGWKTTMDGGMYTSGVEGMLTGKRGDIIIIDDPHKSFDEANSDAILDGIYSWYDTVLSARLQEGSPLVVCHTRWGDRDLTAWLKRERAAENWVHVALPALAEHDDPLGREYDTALCPERFTTETLKRRRDVAPSYAWSGMYQQHPSPPEGFLWNGEWFRRFKQEDIPSYWDDLLLSLDCAFKKTKDSSFVVAQIWAKSGDRRFLLDQVRARMGFIETLEAVAMLTRRWIGLRRLLIEDKANGPAVIEVLEQQPNLAHLTIERVNPMGSKESRAMAVAPQIKAGTVWLPEQAPWIREYMEEVTAFPHAISDDQVDATSQALMRWQTSDGTSWLKSYTSGLDKLANQMAGRGLLSF